MKCSFCQMELESNAQYCAYCGTITGKPSPISPMQSASVQNLPEFIPVQPQGTPLPMQQPATPLPSPAPVVPPAVPSRPMPLQAASVPAGAPLTNPSVPPVFRIAGGGERGFCPKVTAE